ncbi:type IX secretion system outer membrane channel protein PorV [Chitinophaga rhizophila]|uniref:Type IX secretion system outer membrane channel protein PorV n=1 Tax=Chitinophaga rhizophila TaxID=2866212 RepID=A0ABS7GII7_9BACT|nr:type IX secretion system outer membrane channel protein PorV [Chitinophaga rhizophila]MBW8686960.1 type IX secretion system outer membrane channel protein PorV [Chitinophaga rhizophila]
MIRFCFRSATLALLLAAGLPILVCAQDKTLNVATSAAPFLRVSPDARAGGMGEMGLATQADANSPFYNLSKVAFAEAPAGLAVSYVPWLREISNKIYLATVSGYQQLDDNQAIGGALRYFNLGNIQFADAYGNRLGSSSPRELSLEGGYTRKLGEHFSLGLTARYIYSKLASGNANNSGVNYKAGNAFGVDISMTYNKVDEYGKGLTAGAAITNLGSRVNYSNNSAAKEYLPSNLGAGVAYRLPMEEGHHFTFGMELNKQLTPVVPGDSLGLASYYDYSVVKSWFKSFSSANGGFKSFQVSLGGEYSFEDRFFVRAGYFWEDKSHGDRKYITTGLGYKYGMAMINIAYIVPSGNGFNRSPLSNTLRFGATIDLPWE